jgi:hypothetical protein
MVVTYSARGTEEYHKMPPVRKTYFLPKFVPHFQVSFTEVAKLQSLIMHNKLENEISGSWGGEFEDGCLLDCYAMQSGRSLPTFQRYLLPPSWRVEAATTQKRGIFKLENVSMT